MYMDIKRYIDDVIGQNAEGMKAYFHPDAVIRWHCTNEEFTLEEYIKANCEYPDKWDKEIERIDEYGDDVIVALRVFPADGSVSFHVVSFIKLKDDKIMTLDEYWADDGEAPQWRKAMNIGKKIR